MTVRSPKGLIAWQLCDELAALIKELVTPAVQRQDENLYDQLRRAADAAAPQVAEGFGRRTPRQFANYLTMAVSSLMETNNWLQRGTEREYWTAEKGAAAQRLAWRALDMTRKLLASKLRQIAAEEDAKKGRQGSRQHRVT